MPYGVQLHIPFPSRVSPDLERARSTHLAWPRGFGFLSDEADAERHRRANYAELAARFHPAARGADLDLGVDQMSWFFLFDDAFDGPLGADLQRTRRFVDAVAAALDGRPAASAPPIVRAFRDLWERSCAGMSTTWRDRAAGDWRSYLSGYLAEADYRCRNAFPTADEHLKLRRDTIGVQPTVDLAERIGHYEVPDPIFDSQHMRDMRAIAAEVDSVHNDILSVEKEEAQGDIHNLVLILQRDRSRSRQEAIEIMRRMIRERTERFLALEAELPQVSRDLRLGPRETEIALRYSTDALRTVMRGDYDWAEGSGRYGRPEGSVRAAAADA